MIEESRLSAVNNRNKNRDEVENTYQFLFDENPSLLFMINYERRFQDVNNKSCAFSGYDKVDLVGEDPLDFLHPSSRENFSSIIDQLFNKEKVTDTETDFICKDGRIRRILFSSGRLLKFNNQMSVLISGIDITDSRKKLEDFEENSELFTKFMNHLPLGIFIKDNKNNCIFRNRFIADNFDPDIIGSVSTESDSSELSISRFLTLKDKRGNERYCEVTCFSFTTKNKVRFSGGIITDMTSKIEAEKIKRDAGLLKNKTLLEHLPDTLYLIDENGAILDYSGNEGNISKRKSDQIYLRDIFSEDTSDQILKKIKHCLSTGQLEKINYEVLIEGKNNFFESRLVKYNENTVISVNRNFTEEKSNEIQADNYAKQLAELNSSKDKLFSIIAHDLRSPFHGLLGLSEILANEIQDLSPAEIKKIGEELHTTFKNQYRLLENLLAWSLIQRNKIELNIEKVNLSEAVQESIEVLFWTAQKKQINLLNLVNEQVIINYDPNLLSSILQNIITNAIKFSIEKSTVRIEYLKKDGVNVVEIHDDGIGVSDKEIEKIISKDSSFTRKGTAEEQGTGLGLIICREFIERHGGRLYIKSKKGFGTTVGFTLKD